MEFEQRMQIVREKTRATDPCYKVRNSAHPLFLVVDWDALFLKHKTLISVHYKKSLPPDLYAFMKKKTNFHRVSDSNRDISSSNMTKVLLENCICTPHVFQLPSSK